MASEAGRLMKMSLTKIAESRAQPGGVSLHKKLLLVTILKKAHCIFKEEENHMLQSQQGGGYTTSTTTTTPQHHQQQDEYEQNYDDEGLVVLTPEEAGIGSSQHTPHSEDVSSGVNHIQEFLQPSTSCVRCADNIPPFLPSCDADKENQTPPPYHTNPASPQSEVLTYLDLDKSPARGESDLRDGSNATSTSSPRCLKRRRNVGECETEEADLAPEEAGIGSSKHTTISAIPLKRVKISAACCEGDGTVSTTMEVDRVTSLVSILSFGQSCRKCGSSSCGHVGGGGNWNANLSTRNLCSAQSKEALGVLKQRPFRAMIL